MNNKKDLTIKEAFGLAVKNHQNNNLQDAQNYYQQVLKIDPNHIAALNNLGAIFQQLGENQKAKKCLKKQLKLILDFVDAHNNLGIIFQELSESQQAKECYEKAIEINPNHVDAHNNLGNIFKEFGEHQKAKGCYEKAIEINPIYVHAHNNLGNIFKEFGEHQKAKECYEKAIEIDPNHVDAHNNLGVVFEELKEYQKAKDCYEKAIEINPNHVDAHNNLGVVFKELKEYQKAKECFEEAIEIDPNHIVAHKHLSTLHIRTLDDLEKSINLSYKSLKVFHNNSKFIHQSIPLFKLKHDVQQAQYLISKNYKIEGVNEFKKIGSEILDRAEDNYNKRILLTPFEIDALLPFYKSSYVYKPKVISGSCINVNKNWQKVEDEYFNNEKQIIYIDDFLSEEALIELREFCLTSKVWNSEYDNKYLGAFSDQGFISPIHLQIAIELKKELPKLFGPHEIEKFWGFKYDTTLGKGINIHADFAVHNLNFWITPDEFNNNKNTGGLKIYDAPVPDHWIFKDYNTTNDKIYKFLKDNNAKCINVPYKFNRAVLFNSAYFHETDEIDFKNVYEGRRINNTYLFGNRNIKV